MCQRRRYLLISTRPADGLGQANRRCVDRRGTAIVEMAFCLPLLLLLTLGTVDLCNGLHLKQSLVIAAYEGARVGAAQGGTNMAAKARVIEVLNEREIKFDPSTVVTISRTDSPTSGGFDQADTLEHCRVLVRVPVGSNLMTPAGLITSSTIESFVWIRKEFKNSQ